MVVHVSTLVLIRQPIEWLGPFLDSRLMTQARGKARPPTPFV